MTSDTLVHSTSTGKGVTATVVNVLVDRGVLSYDTPIAEVWPEFGAHGKQAATVRHALTHSTGVPGVPAGTTPEDLCDRDGMCAAIAAAKPWWEPGNAGGTFSARAIARMYAALMDGLVSDTVLRGITSVAVDGMDEVIGVPVTRSLGYSIKMMTQTLNSATMFGWDGSGGTIAFADTASRTAYALTKNRHSAGDFSTADLVFNR